MKEKTANKRLEKSIILILFLIVLSLVFSSYSFAETEMINPEEANYTREYKEYLKLSDEEKSKLNVIPPKYAQTLEEYLNTNSNAFTSVKGTLPSSYDLRNVITIPVENQGSDGLCWAFASLTSVETNIALNQNRVVDLSERHVDYLTSLDFWSKYTSSTYEYSRTLGEGGNFDYYFNTIYAARFLGPVYESRLPYDTYVSESQYDSLKAMTPDVYVNETFQIPYISGYEKMAGTYSEEELNIHRDMVKEHVMEYGSLYIDIYAEEIRYYNGYYVMNNQNSSTITNQNHAISLIGWDDNFSKNNFPAEVRPKNNGAYIAQNSWGSYQTVIYISYEDLLIDDFMYGVKSCSLDGPEYQEIKFNDRNFYNYFREQNLGNAMPSYDDANLTLTLSKSYINSYDYIYLYNVGDLKGIEYFTNLNDVSISGSILNNLNALNSLPYLSSLSLHSVGLNDNGTSLNSLQVSSLHLYGIDLYDCVGKIKNMPNLIDLTICFYDLYSNQNLDFSVMPKLKQLSVYNYNRAYNEEGTPTYVVSITGLPTGLRELSLEDTIIDVNIIKPLTGLTYLYLSEIRIDDLSFITSEFTGLESICLYNTCVTNIDAITGILNSQYNNNDYSLTMYIYDSNFGESIDITNVFRNLFSLDKIEINTDRVLYLEYDIGATVYANSDYRLEVSNYPFLFGVFDMLGYSYNEYTTTKIETDNCTALFYEYDPKHIEFIKLNTLDKPGLNIATVDFMRKYSYENNYSCALSLVIKYDVIDPDNLIKPYNLRYVTHIQNIGWENEKYGLWKKDGEMSGTSGKSYRLEGIKIKLSPDIDGGIEYVTHIQNIGWEDAKYGAWKQNGEMSGTSGKSYRLEAIKIRLFGNAANNYDIYYRVHAQNIGWMDWAKNGEAAGTQGYSFRLEGIEIVMVPKGSAAPGLTIEPFREKGKEVKVTYSTHVQNIGDQAFVSNGAIAGTSGLSYRLESIRIKLENIAGDVEYVTHVQYAGWEDKNTPGENWKKNGERSGTAGKGWRLEAIKIRLTGEAAEKYDIYYRVHAQNVGWMGWAKNGEEAGTAGHSFRLEGIQIVLVKKGQNPPAYNPPANKTIAFYN